LQTSGSGELSSFWTHQNDYTIVELMHHALEVASEPPERRELTARTVPDRRLGPGRLDECLDVEEHQEGPGHGAGEEHQQHVSTDDEADGEEDEDHPKSHQVPCISALIPELLL